MPGVLPGTTGPVPTLPSCTFGVQSSFAAGVIAVLNALETRVPRSAKLQICRHRKASGMAADQLLKDWLPSRCRSEQ
jgi:hypothetical protein